MSSQTPRRVGRKRRSPREWAARIALASGVAALGYQSVIFSVAQFSARSRPLAADALVSYDGRLSAIHAAALITPEITAAERATAEALSRTALHRDPTTVAAAATLGVIVLARNESANARHLLSYAQMLSRRNAPTQLWSIEDAVARGDVAGALRWYNITLRTKPDLGDVLYPVLTQASHDPAIRTALVRMLASRPPWSDSYVSYVARQKDDPQNTAALFAELQTHGIVIPALAQSSVVNILLDTGNIDQAWRYYAAVRPGVIRTQARDPRFAAMLEMPSEFDWMPLSDEGVAASIQRGRGGGVFEFSAPASIGGPVLQQIQLLPPGRYRIAGHSDGIAQETRSLPYWMLTCRNDGRQLGRVTLPNSAQAGGMFAGSFTVPADCPVQTLTLFAQASDAIGGTSGQIDRVTLTLAR